MTAPSLLTHQPSFPAPSAENEQGWLRRLYRYCWRHHWQVIIACGASVFGMAIMALIPLVERAIVDDSILSDRLPLLPLAILLVGGALLSFGAAFVRRYIGGRLSLDVQHDLRTELFTSLSRLDGARQDELQTGQIVSRATSDITMVQGLLAMLPYLLGNVLLFVIAMGVMVVLSPLLTVVAFAVGPGLWWIARLSRKRLFPASWEAQQRAAGVASVVDDAVTGVRVVKGFGQEAQELAKLEGAGRNLFASRLRAIRFNSRYNPALQAIPVLGQVAILLLGGWLAIHDQLTLGTFLAFSTYLAQLVGPVRMLAGLLTIGQQARASVIRVFEVIDARPALTEKPDALELPLRARSGGPPVARFADGAARPSMKTTSGEFSGAITFDNVTFGYLASQPVLQGFSVTVQPGETLALVGTSGSGKSTISMLLPRFYDVQEGAIRVDGHDVRDLTLESLRSTIGLVADDSFLFSDTVRANIAYGRPHATDDQIVAAARAAEADEFIRRLPHGYNTRVGEQGLTLSGGQRQRISLARALITDPRFLLLDDATSAVDARIEAEIHATLRRVMRGRTTVLVAHRRSTLALADRIAVLDEGRVVDVGTEQELTQRCPLYRLLLSGPGGDAEGVDAGELAVELTGVDLQHDGVTPALWDPDKAPPRSDIDEASGRGLSAGGPGGRGPMGGMLASMRPTPELLAQVRALPPATETPDIDDNAARAPDPEFTLRRLLRSLTWPLLLGLLLVALDAVASVVLPIFFRSGIDDGITRGAFNAVVTVSIMGLALVIADWGINIAQTYVTGRTGERFLYTLRVKTFAHLQRLGLDYYEREMSGRIMTRMTTDIDALSTFLQTGLTTAVISILLFFGILVALLMLDLALGLVVLTTVPVLIVATLLFRARSSVAYTEAREAVSAVNADLQENVAGMRTTQAYRREGHNRERFIERSNDYRMLRLRAQRYIATYFPFVQFLSDVAAALVLIVGAHFVHNKELTAGALIAYLIYLEMFFSPVQDLSQVFDGYQQARVGLHRLRDLLRTPSGTPEASEPRPVPRLAGEIVFDNVHFAYQEGGQEALSGVNLTVAPGETVALVGATGAGKSTLVKLVSRFYDVSGGRILVDGIDVRDYDLAAYRHRLGVVPQEPYLFPGTVAENISYGRPHASDAEVESAARAVGAHEMIAHLDGGYYHTITERGRNLSTGQRQLIALARAQLVQPDILLMDEATAALDLATEAAVTRASDRLAGQRTTLVVAHRLTTAARADRIVVVEAGRIAEVGTHAELLRAAGVYSGLWTAFSGSAQSHTVV